MLRWWQHASSSSTALHCVMLWVKQDVSRHWTALAHELMACLSAQFLLQDAVRARLGKEAFDFEGGRSAGGSAPYSMGAAQPADC